MVQEFGLVGLGVMGQSLALNIERNGFSIAVYNRHVEKTHEYLQHRAAGKRIVGTSTLAELVAAVQRPRRILLMVKAGAVVDAVLEQLVPHLEQGDLVIDGGNSLFRDTERRQASLAEQGLRYVGMGVSGGEEGALNGPSLMPGGDSDSYELLEPMLTRIAAQVDSGPCVAHLGPGGAGHFVKMVHNGIEYGLMQIIAEAYDLLKHGYGLSAADLGRVFGEWNAGELDSFLMEVAARVVDFPDDQGTGRPLTEMILDRAGQKGTGKWTVMTALELGVPVPAISAAVSARLVSALRDERVQAAPMWKEEYHAYSGDRDTAVTQVREAVYGAWICTYAQGFALMRVASREYGYGLSLAEVARIWRGGCIIRAALLEPIRAAFISQPELPNLLASEGLRSAVAERQGNWRAAVNSALAFGIPVPALSAALAYLDSYRRARLPANLLQAMRDDFGAHTYERIDREGTFHTDWED
jgi:6-phosphogluconate dehydrogenase